MAFQDTVFSRTIEGEARARQPRSISSLELRATLLLVDGKLSVQELKQRFGASLEIEAAIDELHRQGLISSLGAKSDDDVNIARVAEKTANQSSGIAGLSAVLAARIDGRPTATRDEPPIVRPFDEIGVDETDIDSARPEPELRDPGNNQEDIELGASDERREPMLDASNPELDMIGTSEPEINEDLLLQGCEVSDAAAEPPDRGPNLADRTRGGMIATRFFIARAVRGLVPALVIGLVAVSIVAAFLLPERYRSAIEAQAAVQLGQPVQFSALRVSMTGGGSVQLSDIRVPGLGEVSAARVYVLPDIRASLDALAWRFKLQIETLRGRPAALAALLAAPWPSERITKISLENATALVGDERWGEFDGDISMADSQRVARLHSSDRRVVVEAVPDDAGLVLEVVAVNQALRVFPDLALDSYQLRGALHDNRFDAHTLGAAVFGGKLTASGQLTWTEGAVLDAKLTLGRIDTERLFKAVGAGLRINGAISGEFDLVARAAYPAEIRSFDGLSGKFLVENGTLFGMDFGAALRERGMGSIQGGETHFDKLSGRVALRDRSAHVTISKLDAGALDGHGEITIGALEALSGQLSTAVGSNARRVRMPVTIAGSLAAPVLEVRAPPAPKPAPEVISDAFAPVRSMDMGGPELPLEVPVAPGDLR